MGYPWFRRKRFVIMPRYQVGVALQAFLFVLLYSFFLGFLIFYPLHVELKAAAAPDQQLWVSELILEFHTRLWPAVLVVALLAGVQAISATHRIAGPLYRIDKILRGMAAGDYSQRVTLRRGDRFQELATVVNHLGEELTQRRAASLALIRQVQEALEKAQAESTNKEVQQRLKEALQNLQEAEARIHQGY
jgi:methyl-accepting chemotaxis protein